MSNKEDKEVFAKEFQQLILRDPTAFSIPAKRYVRYIMSRSSKDGIPQDLKITALSLQILQFLSYHPNESYLARDIARNILIDPKGQETATSKTIQKPLVSLYSRDYVTRSEICPFEYKIATKGLKYLNKLIGDYDD